MQRGKTQAVVKCNADQMLEMIYKRKEKRQVQNHTLRAGAGGSAICAHDFSFSSRKAASPLPIFCPERRGKRYISMSQHESASLDSCQPVNDTSHIKLVTT